MPGTTTPQVLAELTHSSDGSTQSGTADVNAAGTVVGTGWLFSDNGYSVRATRWNAGSTAIQELDNLGSNHGFAISWAAGVNDAGASVGGSLKFVDGHPIGLRATRWNAGSTAVIELASGASGGEATDINNSGSTVGYTASADGSSQQATLWLESAPGAFIDLNDRLPANSGWALQNATAISDTGFIAGDGIFDPDGAAAAYARPFTMLVPEAGTYGQGDANFDTKVDYADVVILASHYGALAGGSIDVADFDLNGATNFEDLRAFVKHYTGAEPVAGVDGITAAFVTEFDRAKVFVPEPASLAAIGFAIGVVRRRRTR
jgi:hypothetical protein